MTCGYDGVNASAKFCGKCASPIRFIHLNPVEDVVLEDVEKIARTLVHTGVARALNVIGNIFQRLDKRWIKKGIGSSIDKMYQIFFLK
jgi:hypothetical protein